MSGILFVATEKEKSGQPGVGQALTASLGALWVNINNFTEHQHQTKPRDHERAGQKQDHSISMSEHRQNMNIFQAT